jgi:hypothetical protein
MIKLIAGGFLLALAGAAAMPSVAEESTSTVAPEASAITEDAAQAKTSDDGSASDLKIEALGDETSAVGDSEEVETMMDPESGAVAGDEEADD